MSEFDDEFILCLCNSNIVCSIRILSTTTRCILAYLVSAPRFVTNVCLAIRLDLSYSVQTYGLWSPLNPFWIILGHESISWPTNVFPIYFRNELYLQNLFVDELIRSPTQPPYSYPRVATLNPYHTGRYHYRHPPLLIICGTYLCTTDNHSSNALVHTNLPIL